MFNLNKKPVELAWAVPKKEGFNGDAPGLFFHYFEARSQAKAAERAMKKNKQWIGPIECRPGEAWRLC